MFLDFVFSGPEFACLPAPKKPLQKVSANERPPVGDDAFLFQPFRDRDAPFAFRNDDGARRVERPRAFELIGNDERRPTDKQHDDQRYRENAANDANEPT